MTVKKPLNVAIPERDVKNRPADEIARAIVATIANTTYAEALAYACELKAQHKRYSKRLLRNDSASTYDPPSTANTIAGEAERQSQIKRVRDGGQMDAPDRGPDYTSIVNAIMAAKKIDRISAWEIVARVLSVPGYDGDRHASDDEVQIVADALKAKIKGMVR